MQLTVLRENRRAERVRYSIDGSQWVRGSIYLSWKAVKTARFAC